MRGGLLFALVAAGIVLAACSSSSSTGSNGVDGGGPVTPPNAPPGTPPTTPPAGGSCPGVADEDLPDQATVDAIDSLLGVWTMIDGSEPCDHGRHLSIGIGPDHTAGTDTRCAYAKNFYLDFSIEDGCPSDPPSCTKFFLKVKPGQINYWLHYPPQSNDYDYTSPWSLSNGVLTWYDGTYSKGGTLPACP